MRRLPLLVLATGLVAVSGAGAWAAEPERAAWYSAATAGPLTLPAPTLADGDLRVAGTGSQPTAYAALLLPLVGDGAGELVLAVREGSLLGTAELAACPTRTAAWTAGGNQPFDAGPEYDCAAASVFGAIAADGASVSFPLDSSLVVRGALSLALAPLPESTAPFSVDLGDPVFTPAPAAAAPAAPPGEAAPAAPAPAPAPAPALVPGPAGPAGPGAAAGGDDDLAPAPALAALDAPPAEAPALPAADAPAPETAFAPVAPLPTARLAAGRAQDDGTGARLLALLALVGVSVATGYAAGQQRPAPRLLGGRSRAALAAGGATTALAVPATGPARDAALPRGIGRFSRIRDTAPRRLR